MAGGRDKSDNMQGGGMDRSGKRPQQQQQQGGGRQQQGGSKHGDTGRKRGERISEDEDMRRGQDDGKTG